MARIQILVIENLDRAIGFCKEDPAGEPYNYQYFHMNREVMASLFATIRGRKAHVSPDEIPFVYGNEQSSGPWMWELPTEIIQYLLKLRSQVGIISLAADWSDKEVMKSLYTSDIASLLTVLKQVCVDATQSKKSIFVYSSEECKYPNRELRY